MRQCQFGRCLYMRGYHFGEALVCSKCLCCLECHDISAMTVHGQFQQMDAICSRMVRSAVTSGQSS